MLAFQAKLSRYTLIFAGVIDWLIHDFAIYFMTFHRWENAILIVLPNMCGNRYDNLAMAGSLFEFEACPCTSASN